MTADPLQSKRQSSLVQRVRSFVIWHTAGLMNLVGKIHYADLKREIGWRDHLRWWLEGKLGVVFGWAWDGSDEEIEAVINSEVPLEYMSDRQRAYAASLNDDQAQEQPPTETPERKTKDQI